MPPIDPRTELAATIASGEAVIIVGSGVSIQATAAAQCASWRGLIENGIEYCETYALLDANTAVALKALLATGESVALFAAASAVATKLDAPGGGHFREWLARSVGALPIQRPAVLEVLRDTGCQLATTNYDDLLEQITGLRPILWDDSADIQDVLQKRRNGIIHLHGHYATPRSVVLDWGSYSRVTAHEHTQLVLQVMRMMKTIVFVGCGDDGLSDPNFGPFMRDSARIFAGSRQRHYRLCATEALEATRAFHAHDRQIVVLDYGTHDDLSDYLRDLGRARPVSPTPAPARQVIADPGHCFGREAELEQLITELDSDRPARVPILGMGGIGKTTIALTALRDARLQRRFGDARYVVGCESAETRTAVVGLIGTALGLDAKQSTETRVLALLQQRPAVLLLDNFETPWENDPVAIEEWLALLSGIEPLGLV
ncbi:MAG TPA: SIR2 family protein, partial [Thermoanaerobaculia bacterium]|nr:SIR2 family protein [Thermoanaerobaculia bacterium]